MNILEHLFMLLNIQIKLKEEKKLKEETQNKKLF